MVVVRRLVTVDVYHSSCSAPTFIHHPRRHEHGMRSLRATAPVDLVPLVVTAPKVIDGWVCCHLTACRNLPISQWLQQIY